MQLLSINSNSIDKIFFQLFLFVLLFFSYLHYGNPPANTPDLSWMQALGVAYTQELQHGVELMFTYGPLGYFYNGTAPYVPGLFHLFMTWQFLAAIIIASLFILRGSQLSNVLDKFVFFYLALVLLSVQSIHLVDSVYYFSMFLTVTLIADPPRFLKQKFYLGFIIFVILMFSILAVTKFTQFIIAGINVFIIMGIIGHRYGWFRAILIPIGYISLVALLWVTLGQQIEHFPKFVVNSLELAKGYSEAMSLNGEKREAVLAIGVMSLAAFIGIISTFAPKFSIEKLLLTVSIGLGTFMAFKAGLVRHDSPHASIFFGFAMLIPFLFAYDTKMNFILKSFFHLLRYTLIITAVIGLFWTNQFMNVKNMLALWNQNIVENIQKIRQIPEYEEYYKQHIVLLQQQFDLPKIRKIVGNETVDIFSYEQLVVFVNHLNWHPRPIFQSYSAYTPKLLKINRDFYESQQAPKFVIFKLQTLAQRFPIMDDIEAIKVLLRDYVPVLEERDYLLLKRSQQLNNVTTSSVLLKQNIKFDESLDVASLSNEPLLLSLEISKTWVGKVYALLYKSSAVYLELTTVDNEKLLYRIIPNMLKSGVLINPLVINQADFVNWYEGKPLKQVASVKITTNRGSIRQFEDEITLTISSYQ